MSTLTTCGSCGARFLASEGFCPDPECGRPADTPIDDGHTSAEESLPPASTAEVADTLLGRIRKAALDSEQLSSLKPPDQLVHGLLAMDSLAMLYGESGIGKSFVAADIALHVAFGAHWHGRPVKAGKVLYVVAEGAASFGLRITAWKKHHQLTKETHPITWVKMAVNIHDRTWAGALTEYATEVKPVLIVLDTLARSIVGAEENSAKDMGLVVSHLDWIRRATGACVMVVHHSGKNSESGARGSTALKGAMDTELQLKGDSAYMQLLNPKQKDGPQAMPTALRLAEVAGTKSVVVVDGSTGGGELSEKVAQTLAALMDADVPEGLSNATWLEVAMGAGVGKSTFYRHKSELLKRELVVDVSETKAPKYRPAPDAPVRVEAEKKADEIDWEDV